MATCLLGTAPALAEQTSHGAILPSGSHEVGKDRFQSPSPYGDTMKFYWKTYAPEHYPRKPVADLPGVRATHIENPGRGGWEGLNVYEVNGSTRIFVLTRESAKNRRPTPQ